LTVEGDRQLLESKHAERGNIYAFMEIESGTIVNRVEIYIDLELIATYKIHASRTKSPSEPNPDQTILIFE
jgi:hypothetical protein